MNSIKSKEKRKIWYMLRKYYHIPPHRTKLYLKTWNRPDSPKINKKAYLKMLKEFINNKPLWVIMDYFK